MPGEAAIKKKAIYIERLMKYFTDFKKVILVSCDNVGSNQMQQIRLAIRGKGELLMGKNTLIRKGIKQNAETRPDIQEFGEKIRGNVGLVFTNEDLVEVRDTLEKFKVPAIAKAGAISPVDVTIPKGNTGLEPTQTSFLQALNIATKIVRGQIEILNDYKCLSKGDKVSASQAALMLKMNIKPFEYGLVPTLIFDEGSIFSPAVLDITSDDIANIFVRGVSHIASISLQLGFPTRASIPHSIRNGYQKLVAIALATEYTFPQVEELKALLSDPEALAAAQAAAASAAPAAGDAAPAEEAAPEEEEEESDEEMGFGLFD